MTKPDWITSFEAARTLKVSPQRVRTLCIQGRLTSEKFGRDWFIDPASVEEFREARKSGRPRNP